MSSLSELPQSACPVLDALADYKRTGYLGFTPPGHKQGRGADPRVVATLGADVFKSDVLATAGLDDRSASGAVIQKAQTLMARAVGAEHAFFSTCGSSLSVKSAMLAVAGPGQSLLVGRDAHKSVISGLVIAGIQPIWVQPRWDTELHLAHPPSPESIERSWAAHPDAAGLLITSPTPYGTCADLAAVVEICHRRGKPVIVDEAWGAHLPFSDELPTWAMDAGADVCVVSVHKMGAGLEQGSVFHLQGKLVDPTRLMECEDLLATTSSNVLLYAAMDGWRRQMVEQGAQLLGSALALARRTRERIEGIPGLHVLESELLGAAASHDLDRLQILIDLRQLGISGYQAADWLRAEQRINMGMSDHRRIGAQFTFADSDDTADALVHALGSLAEASAALAPARPIMLPDPSAFEVEPAMLPREAFFAPAVEIPAEQSVGRVSIEQITPYPPGIPALLPGERINEQVLDYLTSGITAGMVIPDSADPELKTVRVVR
jgi:arginine/lysine/ornithine decarboxylase